jgi:hypothetical protein
MRHSWARHERRTPREERTLSGMMGSGETRYSTATKRARELRAARRYQNWMSPARP